MGFTISDSIEMGFKQSYTNLYVNFAKGMQIKFVPRVVAQLATETEPAVDAKDEYMTCSFSMQFFENKDGKQLYSCIHDVVLVNGVLSIAELYSVMKAGFISTVDC